MLKATTLLLVTLILGFLNVTHAGFSICIYSSKPCGGFPNKTNLVTLAFYNEDGDWFTLTRTADMPGKTYQSWNGWGINILFRDWRNFTLKDYVEIGNSKYGLDGPTNGVIQLEKVRGGFYRGYYLNTAFDPRLQENYRDCGTSFKPPTCQR
ncbi:MAG: hypothetical protein J3R72DRAFT_442531 [Linnemannia gamsii]|nr:MAG: hypothetical protein J3R72DRAFT_442531 [Linnemannia gamsii]